jgi:hypothetical protein
MLENCLINWCVHRHSPTKCRVFLCSAMPFSLLVHPNIFRFPVCLDESEQCSCVYGGNSPHKKQTNTPALGNTSQVSDVSLQTVRFDEGIVTNHHVQNGSGAHPASYTMGTRGSFPGGKAAGARGKLLTSF